MIETRPMVEALKFIDERSRLLIFDKSGTTVFATRAIHELLGEFDPDQVLALLNRISSLARDAEGTEGEKSPEAASLSFAGGLTQFFVTLGNHHLVFLDEARVSPHDELNRGAMLGILSDGFVQLDKDFQVLNSGGNLPEVLGVMPTARSIFWNARIREDNPVGHTLRKVAAYREMRSWQGAIDGIEGRIHVIGMPTRFGISIFGERVAA